MPALVPQGWPAPAFRRAANPRRGRGAAWSTRRRADGAFLVPAFSRWTQRVPGAAERPTSCRWCRPLHPAVCGQPGAPPSRKRIGRTRRSPSASREHLCYRARALWRAHKPGPWTLLSCLGPGDPSRQSLADGFMMGKSSGTHLILPSLGRSFLHLHCGRNSIDRQRSCHAQRPGESPATLRLRQALRTAVQIGTPAGLSNGAIRDHLLSPDDHTQKVGLLIPLTTTYAGPQRAGSSDPLKVYPLIHRTRYPCGCPARRQRPDRTGCRSANPSFGPPVERSAPRGLWPATVGSRARSPGRHGQQGRR